MLTRHMSRWYQDQYRWQTWWMCELKKQKRGIKVSSFSWRYKRSRQSWKKELLIVCGRKKWWVGRGAPEESFINVRSGVDALLRTRPEFAGGFHLVPRLSMSCRCRLETHISRHDPSLLTQFFLGLTSVLCLQLLAFSHTKKSNSCCSLQKSITSWLLQPGGFDRGEAMTSICWSER